MSRNYLPEHSASIAEWNAAKGFGWLQFGDRRLFLHVRDLERGSVTPRVGDVIRFTVGCDSQGRPCATRAISSRRRHEMPVGSLLLLAGLLVLPAVALDRLPIDLWRLVAYVVVISAITYRAYAEDKRRARTNAWRIAESSLHLMEMLGGWPGAWLAQMWLRHKSSKKGYQFIFWGIILIHQVAAFDSLQGWKIAQEIVEMVQRVVVR